jgi:hypothetical protein
MKAVFERFSTRPGRSGAVLFWGSLWGIWEATAGHVFHLIHVPGLPGFVMFPVAFYFMSRAFVRSGRYDSIFLTALVAAGIKLFDFFIPGQNIQAVVNPARAILLESLAVAGFYSLWSHLSFFNTILDKKRSSLRGS